LVCTLNKKEFPVFDINEEWIEVHQRLSEEWIAGKRADSVLVDDVDQRVKSASAQNTISRADRNRELFGISKPETNESA
jgi:hypothetical protein